MRNLTILFLAGLLLACTDAGRENPPTPQVIRLGVLPDQSIESLVAKYSPLIGYLAQKTGLEFELVVSDGYAGLLEDFHADRVDIANFGGLTFIQAERRDNAVPLVMRDTDLNFASCYLVSAADDRSSVAEFYGESFAFGPRLSTSGHLMPRYFLNAAGIDPDTFFASIRHSSGHDETAILVRDGDVGIGVANCLIVASMNADGRLQPGEVRILETTPAYADYVWAVHEHMDASKKMLLRDAFLALDAVDPEHQAILKKLGANAYLPASHTDFEDVRRAASDANVAAMLGLK